MTRKSIVDGVVKVNEVSASLADYIAKGTGTEIPANQSIYDALTWKMQPDATLSQVLVQDTDYDLLPTTANVRLIYIQSQISVADETILMTLVMDGESWSSALNFVAGTSYSIYLGRGGQSLLNGTAYQNVGLYLPVECRSCRIYLRKTTNNGAGTFSGVVTLATR